MAWRLRSDASEVYSPHLSLTGLLYARLGGMKSSLTVKIVSTTSRITAVQVKVVAIIVIDYKESCSFDFFLFLFSFS